MSKILTQLTIQANYRPLKILGSGTFGVVVKALSKKDGQIVAMKKVYQDHKYKNRELEIMKSVKHRNVVKLLDYFFTTKKTPIPLLFVKVYIYQMLRAIATIHRLGICHRDIKPQNLLINPTTFELRVCDFGSAKRLVIGTVNNSYICSRYYRAPELLFGSNNYTNNIDVWSIGCVFAEMLILRPLFPGQSGVKQLVQIIRLMGTPTREEIIAMNPNYSDFKLPQIEKKPWNQILRNDLDHITIDLLSRLLQYNPDSRIDPLEACAHPFFDELRDPKTLLPNNLSLPELFDFDSEELNSVGLEIRQKLVPSHIVKSRKKWKIINRYKSINVLFIFNHHRICNLFIGILNNDYCK